MKVATPIVTLIGIAAVAATPCPPWVCGPSGGKGSPPQQTVTLVTTASDTALVTESPAAIISTIYIDRTVTSALTLSINASVTRHERVLATTLPKQCKFVGWMFYTKCLDDTDYIEECGQREQGWVKMAAHEQAGGPNQDAYVVRKECLVPEDDPIVVQRLDKLRKEAGAEPIGILGLQYRLECTLEKCTWVDFQRRPRTSNWPLEVEGASPANASA